MKAYRSHNSLVNEVLARHLVYLVNSLRFSHKILHCLVLCGLLVGTAGSAMALCNGDPNLVSRSIFDPRCVHPPCGRDGETACTILVRIPSCDTTLAESGGRCVQCGGVGEIACPVTVQVPSCDATLAESGGRCVQCGGSGEIACPVTVQFPSCDANLVESNGICVRPPCGREGEVACTAGVRIPSCDAMLAEVGGLCVHCGRQGEVACPVTVRIPSCDATLAESGGRCVQCGGMGEIACPVSVQVPSCDATLAESGGRCIHCGRLGEVACPVTVRIPSCDATLAESGGRCVQCGGLGEIACPVTVRMPSCRTGLMESNGRCVTITYLYRGGEIVSNPDIVVVYWGTQPRGLRARLDRFYAQIVSSRYFNLLAEYNTPLQTFGTPRLIGSFLINQGRRTRAVDTISISREIDRQIRAGRLPAPTTRTIYMVHFGRATPPAMGTNILGHLIGAETGQGFCAYHFTARTQVPAIPPLVDTYGPKIRIAVIPDASVIPACLIGNTLNTASTLNTATYSATHELVETMTNPDSVIVGMYPTAGETLHCNGIVLQPVSGLISNSTWAWVSNKSIICNPNEVADECDTATFNTSSSTLDSYTVSQIWRNSTGACSNP